jgi:pSer/pThr/pTyr-binding forkhead associated (FHA) protein
MKPQVTLLVRSGKYAGHQLQLNRDEFLIGRGEQCHLRPRNEAVSRQHCGIFIQPGRVVLKDFDSKNGTFVNGQRVVGEVELHDGDMLQVADLAFEVRVALPADMKPAAQKIGTTSAQATAGPAAGSNRQKASASEEVDLVALIGPPELGSSPTRAFDPTGGASSRAFEDTVIGQAHVDTVSNAPALGSTSTPSGEQSSEQVKVVGVAKDRWKPKYANPREAAADALRKFFGKA